jgi:hypothetical protein
MGSSPGRYPARPAVRKAIASLPQGPSLGSEFYCLGPSSLNRPHPPVSRAHRNFAVFPLISCAFAVRGAPRRPARPSRLSLLSFPNVQPTPTPAGPNASLSRYSAPGSRVPLFQAGFSPTTLRLCQQYSAETRFRGRLVRFVCYSPLVRLALLTGYDTVWSSGELPPLGSPLGGFRRFRLRTRLAVSMGGSRQASRCLLRTSSPPLLTTSLAGRDWGSGSIVERETFDRRDSHPTSSAAILAARGTAGRVLAES